MTVGFTETKDEMIASIRRAQREAPKPTGGGKSYVVQRIRLDLLDTDFEIVVEADNPEQAYRRIRQAFRYRFMDTFVARPKFLHSFRVVLDSQPTSA
jgi:hypothetical protein